MKLQTVLTHQGCTDFFTGLFKGTDNEYFGMAYEAARKIYSVSPYHNQPHGDRIVIQTTKNDQNSGLIITPRQLKQRESVILEIRYRNSGSFIDFINANQEITYTKRYGSRTEFKGPIGDGIYTLIAKNIPETRQVGILKKLDKPEKMFAAALIGHTLEIVMSKKNEIVKQYFLSRIIEDYRQDLQRALIPIIGKENELYEAFRAKLGKGLQKLDDSEIIDKIRESHMMSNSDLELILKI